MYISAVVENKPDGEILEAFSGETVDQAAESAVTFMISKRPAKSVRIVVHDEDSMDVVWSFEMVELYAKGVE